MQGAFVLERVPSRTPNEGSWREPQARHQMKHGAKRTFSHVRTDIRKGITAQAKHIRTRARTDNQRSWQDIAQMYSQRALGRQKGVSQARYSRDVFPSIIFHRFSRLKTYIRRLSCQKQAIRACISAISCHEEAFLASERPSRMHDSHFLPPDSHSLPLLDAQPPSSHGAFSRLVMAAFLLRSPFRSRLRRAFHRARNR